MHSVWVYPKGQAIKKTWGGGGQVRVTPRGHEQFYPIGEKGGGDANHCHVKCVGLV